MDVHPAFMRLFRSLFWALLALHLFAGVWFMLADQELAADPAAVTWLSIAGHATAPVHSQYIVSVYFMLSTFTQLGIGDVTPQCVGGSHDCCLGGRARAHHTASGGGRVTQAAATHPQTHTGVECATGGPT